MSNPSKVILNGGAYHVNAGTVQTLVEQRDALIDACATLLGNARVIPDPTMAYTTDVYAVPLDDVQRLAELLDVICGASRGITNKVQP